MWWPRLRPVDFAGQAGIRRRIVTLSYGVINSIEPPEFIPPKGNTKCRDGDFQYLASSYISASYGGECPKSVHF